MMAHLLGQEVIIEIFKACRLCGQSNSDRFPIVHLENGRDKNTELNKIIRETVLIEVRDRDKMPPLICEVCIDKVHQFYEFRESVLSTDLRIRTRLGLPSQEEMFILDSADIFENETILGDTVPVTIEPVTTNSVKKYRPGPKSKKHTLLVNDEVKEKRKLVNDEVKEKRKPKNVPVAKEVGKKKGEPQNNKSKKQNAVREEKSKKQSRVPRELLALQSFAMYDMDLSDSSRSRRESRSSGAERRAQTPPAPARVTRSGVEVPSKKPDSPPPPPPPPLKSILKNSSKKDLKTKPMLHQQIEANLASRKKRQRDQPQTSEAPAAKKIRLTIKLPPPPPLPAAPFKCQICAGAFQTKAALSTHLRRHVPNYTDPKLCCTACHTWFPELVKATAHHSKHGPYRCKRCGGKHRTREIFDDHITQKKCLPWEATPDVRCPECWASFITQTLCDQHQCKGVSARPVKCDLCGGQYATAQTLRKHRKACSLRYKGKPSKIPAAARRRFHLAAVRLRRCDAILPARGRIDARTVTQNFDLDKKYIYPFNPFGREIKKEKLRFNTMVSIREDAKNFLYKEEDYVHWDSDMSTDSEDELDNSSKSRVDSLSTLSLKTLFSKQCLGKVPRKLRKVKPLNIFDSIFNDSKADSEFTNNIDSIIDHLDSEVDGVNRSVNSCGYDSDSLLNNCEKSVVGDASKPRVVHTPAYLKQGNVDINSLKDSLKGLNDSDSGVNLGKNDEDSLSFRAENRKDNDDETSAEENNDESNANDNDFNDNSQSTDRTDYDDASHNGDVDDEHEKVNGSSYDSTKALLDELDAQIDDRGVIGKEGNVANKGKDTSLDNISDTEYDFK